MPEGLDYTKWDGVNNCYVNLSDLNSYQEFRARYEALMFGDDGAAMAKGWGDRLAPVVRESKGWEVGESSGNLGISQSIAKCATIKEMAIALTEVCPKATVTKRVINQGDPAVVVPFVASLVGTCQKTYGFIPPIGNIVMKRGDKNICVIRLTQNGNVDVELYGGYFTNAASCKRKYAEMVKFGQSANGTTFESVGAHEATHIAECVIALASSPTTASAKKIAMSQNVGRVVITRAVAKQKGVGDSAVRKEDITAFLQEFQENVSDSVIVSPRESMCEAAQDVDSNGDKAYYLSKYLVDAMKEVLNEVQV